MIPGQTEPSNNRRSQDLQDSPSDEKSMQEEKEIIMDLPEVKDIPGQENIVPPKMNAFADTTISSDDEEGVGILDDVNRSEEDTDQ